MRFLSARHGVIQNVGILAAGQVAGQLLNVWALVFLAGRLGPHWFGVVQVGVAFMAYACVVAEWGFFSLGIREIARLDDNRQIFTYARRHTGLLGVQALAVLAVGVVILPWLPFNAADPWVFRFYLLTVLVQALNLSWVAAGIERMALVSLTRTVLSLLYAVLILLFLEPLAGRTGITAARWVPIIFLAANLGSSLVIGGALRRFFGRWILPALPPVAEARRRWREASQLGGSIVVMRVLLNVDLFVLGILATPSVAGSYAAASRLIFLLVIAVEVLWSALLPRLSRLAASDRPGFRRSFNGFLGFTLAGMLPAAVGGVLVGPDLIALLYQGRYPDGGPVFQVLAVSYTFLAVATFLGNALIAENRQRDYFAPIAVSAVVAIVGTAALVPGRGAFGASLGMLASHALLCAVLVARQRRLLDGGLGLFLLQVLPALAIMALAVHLAGNWPVIPRIALGGGLYLLVAAWPMRRFLAAVRAPGEHPSQDDPCSE